MYAGAEIYIRFTCKEKLPQDTKPTTINDLGVEEIDIPKGIVKWLVEMIDETEELVGVATILTMVKRK